MTGPPFPLFLLIWISAAFLALWIIRRHPEDTEPKRGTRPGAEDID